MFCGNAQLIKWSLLMDASCKFISPQ
ncbi:hypothetical protein E2C01_091210 [Portunus trituberculatus]|uniref:Uncharacterized protein n=1 Tax=Portunus trituberculatus TaxID=210409 RepID=A0A5B7JS58_PORTR|nr:hypothetical protein [Portunus trituberculatus]